MKKAKTIAIINGILFVILGILALIGIYSVTHDVTLSASDMRKMRDILLVVSGIFFGNAVVSLYFAAQIKHRFAQISLVVFGAMFSIVGLMGLLNIIAGILAIKDKSCIVTEKDMVDSKRKERFVFVFVFLFVLVNLAFMFYRTDSFRRIADYFKGYAEIASDPKKLFEILSYLPFLFMVIYSLVSVFKLEWKCTHKGTVLVFDLICLAIWIIFSSLYVYKAKKNIIPDTSGKNDSIFGEAAEFGTQFAQNLLDVAGPFFIGFSVFLLIKIGRALPFLLIGINRKLKPVGVALGAAIIVVSYPFSVSFVPFLISSLAVLISVGVTAFVLLCIVSAILPKFETYTTSDGTKVTKTSWFAGDSYDVEDRKGNKVTIKENNSYQGTTADGASFGKDVLGNRYYSDSNGTYKEDYNGNGEYHPK